MIFSQVHHCEELLSNTGHHALAHFPDHNDDDDDGDDDDDDDDGDDEDDQNGNGHEYTDDIADHSGDVGKASAAVGAILPGDRMMTIVMMLMMLMLMTMLK